MLSNYTYMIFTASKLIHACRRVIDVIFVLQLFVQRTMECMVLHFLSMDKAKEMFPNLTVEKLPSGKPYMRTTSQPKPDRKPMPEPEESASDSEESASDPEEHAD